MRDYKLLEVTDYTFYVLGTSSPSLEAGLALLQQPVHLEYWLLCACSMRINEVKQGFLERPPEALLRGKKGEAK